MTEVMPILFFRKFYDEGRATDLFVRCGEWDTRRVVEPVPHQDRPVADVAVHPGYDRKNLTNNVALLFTETPFILGHSLDKICMPSSNYEERYNWDECVSTGWGKDQFGDEGEFQVVLKQVRELNYFPLSRLRDFCVLYISGHDA